MRIIDRQTARDRSVHQWAFNSGECRDWDMVLAGAGYEMGKLLDGRLTVFVPPKAPPPLTSHPDAPLSWVVVRTDRRRLYIELVCRDGRLATFIVGTMDSDGFMSWNDLEVIARCVRMVDEMRTDVDGAPCNC